MKRIYLLLLVALPLLWAVEAAPAYGQQDAKAKANARKEQLREEKNVRKAEKRQLNQEIRLYENMRDSAGLAFCKANPPSVIFSPYQAAFSISDVICGADEHTGMIILYLTVTSRLLDPFLLLIGGSLSGTEIYTNGNTYPSSSFYGQHYTIRTGMPQEFAITFYGIDRSVKTLDRIEIGVGYRQDIINTIVMYNVPIFWTVSDRAIRNYMRAQAEEHKTAEAQKEQQLTQ